MRPLPQSVRGIEVLVKLQYVKAKNKVLLVEPATRTVVDQITSSAKKPSPAGRRWLLSALSHEISRPVTCPNYSADFSTA
jgi:hypothetical protein